MSSLSSNDGKLKRTMIIVSSNASFMGYKDITFSNLMVLNDQNTETALSYKDIKRTFLSFYEEEWMRVAVSIWANNCKFAFFPLWN